MRKIFIPVGVPEEGERFEGPIVVGTGMTEHFWSDSHAYEVVAVRDQKHVTVRRLDHEKATGAEWCENDWVLWSDDSLPTKDLIRIGDIWYWTWKDDDTGRMRRSKANVSFGYADYYYDYEF